MELDKILNSNLVALDIVAKEKNEVIQVLSQRLYEEGLVSSVSGYMEDVLKREEEGTTNMGMRIAIPHGKSAAVNQASFAFGRLKNPIKWDDSEDPDVSAVFLLAVPLSEASTTHLALIAKIASLLMDEEFTNHLFTISTKEEFMDLIKKNLEM